MCKVLISSIFPTPSLSTAQSWRQTFSTAPKYIIMVQPRYVTLTDFFVNRVFRIPSYQRFYSWQYSQREDLFNDIRTLFKASADSHHFMATIVCHDTGEKASVGSTDYRVFEVVDGQQRITSLIILLRAVAKKLPVEEDRKEIERILVKRDDNVLLLQTNNANQKLFSAYLRSGAVPLQSQVETHADRTLRDGIVQTEKFVENWGAEDKSYLELLRLVTNRLGFVVYDTEDRHSVYTIFEVLNSRGLEVDWLDKCKSVLMGRAFETAKNPTVGSAAIGELEAQWGKIYQRLAVFPVKGQEVLRVTATTRCESDAGKPMSAEASLAALKALCNTPADARDITEWIFNTADALVKLEQQQHLGPVTDVLHARVLAVAIELAGQLNECQRQQCLDQWERVTFRIFGILRKDARTKVGDYIRLARKILREESEASTFNRIFTELKKLGAGDSYTITKAVQDGLANRNCYEGFEAECRYLLWRYEEHLAKEAGGEVNKELRAEIWNARSAAETIEHIYPQNAESGGPWKGKLKKGESAYKHVHRIGNLLLLPKVLNSKATRKGFEEKKIVFVKTEGLRIVKEVIAKADWTQAEIEEREKKILEWVRNAWDDLPEI
jgi:hypothetical protein